ncbi:MAG: hypothetical protein ILA29_05485 [Prevotella sp.]|nr:hypothetical protein [Prevotella sp.]
MKTIFRLLPLLFCLLAIAFLTYHLDVTQRFLFFQREQQQMFLFDGDFIADRYFSLGGLSLFVAQFMVQFFSLQLAGPLLTAITGVLMSLILWKALRRFSKSLILLALCFMPLLYQVESLFDFNYGYDGFIAMTLMVGCFWLYTAMAERLSGRWHWRIALSVVLSLAVYISMGPVGLLFAVMVLLYDIFTKAEKWYFQVLPLALVLLAGFWLVSNGRLESERFALLPDFHYEPILKPVFRHYISWIALVAVLLAAFVISRLPKLNATIDVAIAAVLFVVVAWLFIRSANITRKKDLIFPVIEIQHYVATGQWDEILNSKYLRLNSYLIANYCNLALSHQGRLLDNLFAFPQQGVNTLMVQGEYAEMSIETFVASPHIFYQMGNIAVARNKAFDASVAFQYGNPTIAQMLAKTNIVYGDYPIAERYLNMLKKTWGYADWARRYEKFLYNDAAVEADPELGLKRKDLPRESPDIMSRGVYVDLLNILDGGTPDRAVFEYAVAFLLLSRDAEDTRKFVEKYYATPVMATVPVLLQEALVEQNPADYCLSYGVSQETIDRYKDFQQMFLDVQSGDAAAEAMFEQKFQNTYWYYSLNV